MAIPRSPALWIAGEGVGWAELSLTRALQARMEELRKETDDHYQYQPTGLPLYPSFRQAK